MATITVLMDSDDARRLVVLVDEYIKTIDERIESRLEEGDAVSTKMKMALDRLYSDKAVFSSAVAAIRNGLMDLYNVYPGLRNRNP